MGILIYLHGVSWIMQLAQAVEHKVFKVLANQIHNAHALTDRVQGHMRCGECALQRLLRAPAAPTAMRAAPPAAPARPAGRATVGPRLRSARPRYAAALATAGAGAGAVAMAEAAAAAARRAVPMPINPRVAPAPATTPAQRGAHRRRRPYRHGRRARRPSRIPLRAAAVPGWGLGSAVPRVEAGLRRRRRAQRCAAAGAAGLEREERGRGAQRVCVRRAQRLARARHLRATHDQV